MKTKTKTDCKTKDLCHYDSLTRTKFFHGMLLTDEHLRDEQTYHRESLKRLNRHLWGAGIVCGLEVDEPAAGLCIKVHPGLALDCDGNTIEVCKTMTVDLGEFCKKAFPDGCPPEKEAEFEKYRMTKYLVLRYRELAADPQPVLTPDDDCTPAAEGTKCEASKYREGFCLELRDECPDCLPCDTAEKEGSPGLLPFLVQLSQYAPPEIRSRFEEYQNKPGCMEAPPCDDCECEDPAVGLAKLDIDCAKNTVKVACDCRHYVWSPRLLRWLICGLFANMDKIPMERFGLKENLPSASTLYRNPLHTAWKVGVMALEARKLQRLQQEVKDLSARLDAVEDTQTKPKPKRGQ